MIETRIVGTVVPVYSKLLELARSGSVSYKDLKAFSYDDWELFVTLLGTIEDWYLGDYMESDKLSKREEKRLIDALGFLTHLEPYRPPSKLYRSFYTKQEVKSGKIFSLKASNKSIQSWTYARQAAKDFQGGIGAINHRHLERKGFRSVIGEASVGRFAIISTDHLSILDKCRKLVPRKAEYSAIVSAVKDVVGTLREYKHQKEVVVWIPNNATIKVKIL